MSRIGQSWARRPRFEPLEALPVWAEIFAFLKRSPRLWHPAASMSTAFFGPPAKTLDSGPVRPPASTPSFSTTRRLVLGGLAGAAGALALGTAGCGSPAAMPASGRLRRLAEARWPHRLSIGGTPAEAWVRREALAAHSQLAAMVRGR